MNKKIENLKDLFVEQGREFYDTSLQEKAELPIIQQHVKNQQLKKIINRQLNLSKDQNHRIEQAFKKLNLDPKGEKNECCASVFKHAKSLINRSTDAEVRDAVIVNSIQRLNHSKITQLGSLAAYAKEIDHEDIAISLRESLKEEMAMDKELSELAALDVNRRAVTTTLV